MSLVAVQAYVASVNEVKNLTVILRFEGKESEIDDDFVDKMRMIKVMMSLQSIMMQNDEVLPRATISLTHCSISLCRYLSKTYPMPTELEHLKRIKKNRDGSSSLYNPDEF